MIETRERGVVQADGERVQYTTRTVDYRTAEHKARDERLGRPEGNVIVVVPGHGQTVDGPRNLAAAAARLSRSKIVWCIDPTPTSGGDCTEGRALGLIVEELIRAVFPAGEEGNPNPQIKATAMGWSHGGAEALQGAAFSEVIDQWLGLCPTGMVDRSVPNLAGTFALEALRVVGRAVMRMDWACLVDVLRVGTNFLVGTVIDLSRTRAPSRLVDDVCWACKQVPGPAFPFTGEAVLVFGRQDTVIRWQDAFPGCVEPHEIEDCMPEFLEGNFPKARSLQVCVIEGNHMSPESESEAFVKKGFELLGQLDHGSRGLSNDP